MCMMCSLVCMYTKEINISILTNLSNNSTTKLKIPVIIKYNYFDPANTKLNQMAILFVSGAKEIFDWIEIGGNMKLHGYVG